MNMFQCYSATYCTTLAKVNALKTSFVKYFEKAVHGKVIL